MEDIFNNEMDPQQLDEARKRLSSSLSQNFKNANLSFNSMDFKDTEKLLEERLRNYLTEKPDKIKEFLVERADLYYEKAINEFNLGNFERTMTLLNKAFSLNTLNVRYYILKCECFIQMCDFKSAILTINKLLSVISVWSDSNDLKIYDTLKANLNEKTTFCHYMMGQIYFDSKLYFDALDSFNKASELRPDNLVFKIRSVSCLFAMNRITDALTLVNKIMNEDEANQTNSNLFVLRARLYMKASNVRF